MVKNLYRSLHNEVHVNLLNPYNMEATTTIIKEDVYPASSRTPEKKSRKTGTILLKAPMVNSL